MPSLSSILLVDDDDTANFLHRLLLNRMGVAGQVQVARDGQQALDLLTAPAATPPGLILLDLNMPVLNGLEFLARYAHLSFPAAAPVVVVLSSSDHSLDMARAQPLPVAAYLTKPLTQEKVTALLNQYFAS